MALWTVIRPGVGFAEEPSAASGGDGYVQLIHAHLQRFCEIAVDRYGEDTSAMWIASVDLERGGQNEGVAPTSRRAYRRIHSPRGSNLYWDLPTLIAAHRVADLTGDASLSDHADRYVGAFLARCVSDTNGLFLWGNHLFYDVHRDTIERIGHFSHEARPMPVAWGVIQRRSPAAAARCIRSMAAMHIIDTNTGFFDRHASTERRAPKTDPEHVAGCYPFIESGGVLIESMAVLAGDNPSDRPRLVDEALRVARFCADHRGERTGIIRNQGNRDRWDYHHGTTEVGLWAGNLLRAARLTGEDDFVEVAEPGLLAYLKHGWDEDAGKYFGALRVEDGVARRPADEKPYPYQPERYSDIWEPLFPIHDYPMAMAEACLDFYAETGREPYREAARRWVRHVAASLPARYSRERYGASQVEGAYAANYGAVIHFLTRAESEIASSRAGALADQLAKEAIDRLYDEKHGAFRSHVGEDVVDTIDGLGVLFLALLRLETGTDGDLMGFHF